MHGNTDCPRQIALPAGGNQSRFPPTEYFLLFPEHSDTISKTNSGISSKIVTI